MPKDPYETYQNDPYDTYQNEAASKPTTWGDRAKEWGEHALDVGKGVVKGGLEAAQGLYRLENFGQQDANGDNPFPKGSKEFETYGKVARSQEDFHKSYAKTLESRNAWQTGGKIVEAVAETAAMPEFAGAGRAVRGAKIIAKAPELVKAGLEIGTKASLQGFVQGTAHSGSVTEGAKQGAIAGAAGPMIAGLTTPAGKLLQKTGQKLYERFLIPGGGPGYNKGIALNGAEELIKRGEFALTKGGFTQKIEQRLMDSEVALKKAEDEALGKMGYAPTGAQSWHVRTETTSEEMPTITLYPEPGPPGTGVAQWSAPNKEVTRYGNIAKRETAVGQHLGDPEQTTSRTTSRTRVRTEKVNETRQGLVDMRPVIQKLREAQNHGLIQGDTVLGYKGVTRARNRLIEQIYGWSTPNLHMDARDVIKLRRALDGLLNWERTPGSAPLKPGVQKAVEDGANFVREEINSQVTGMREANGNYSFYTGINKVLKDKANQTVGHRAMGLLGKTAVMASGMTGYLHGGTAEAVALTMLAGAVETGINSGANLTGSAIAADRVGKLLQSGRVQQALIRLATVGAGAVRDKPQSSSEK